MTNFFGSFIHKILSSRNLSKLHSRRCISIFKKSKDRRDTHLSPYIILKPTKEDYETILKLMHEAYYPEEPTCFSLGIARNTVMDETALKNLAEGISLVARSKYDGCIVGACINETSNRWDPDLKEKLAASVQCSNVKQLLLFQAHIQRFPQLWDCYCVQKIFEISNLFVKKFHSRSDIAERLLNESKELAADCGYKVVRLNATSLHLAELAKSMNMELAAEMPYCLYVGRNMKPVFDPPYPNDSVKVFIDVDPQIKKASIKK
ncbi:uncharacterized protein [Leptinotarsa decemlineata]|uniref:uncharacterized protein n=1 Tax=Leptinotarsa decemlineata TaxID=7539 RepID=UPI000C2521FA|nr:uncharacterized protein LOC111516147 [Leptinotarsa decemlineata]